MITIEQMNQLAQKISELRIKEAEAALIKREITAELESCEKEMVALLEESGLKNYRSPHGMAAISYRTSVKTPKEHADREAFFNYLREIGKYDSMISVNSQTLNSFYKEQFELAQERGDIEFSIPGITEVTVSPVLSFRK